MVSYLDFEQDIKDFDITKYMNHVMCFMRVNIESSMRHLLANVDGNNKKRTLIKPQIYTSYYQLTQQYGGLVMRIKDYGQFILP